jgi:hypothetical protein
MRRHAGLLGKDRSWNGVKCSITGTGSKVSLSVPPADHFKARAVDEHELLLKHDLESDG